MTKTTFKKSYESATNWHFIDAQGKVLGKVASEISKILIGKHKPEYSPITNTGDKVVVTNAAKIAVTGNKLDQKLYHRHTGYPGGIRTETLRKLMQRRPTEALRRAVKGMLPRNKMMDKRLSNLYIYEADEHPHQGQKK